MQPRKKYKRASSAGNGRGVAVASTMSAGAEASADVTAVPLAPGYDFEAARERTVQALTALASRWRDAGARRSFGAEAMAEAVAEAVDKVLTDPGALCSEGFSWSQAAGLAFVLPSGALQCEPLAQSIGADGLNVSTVGGPVVPTHAGVIVAPAPPCGYGVFATVPLKKGERLGEYLGTARSYKVWEKEIEDAKVARHGSDARVPFIPDELYAAWTGQGLGAGVVVDAFAAGNAMRFINCSCKPNANFTKFGHGHQQHCRLQVIAARDIEAWEQLSVDYGWYHDDGTLQDVRAEALKAFNRDVSDIRSLGAWLREQDSAGAGGIAGALLSESVPDSLKEGRSEPVRVLVEAANDARGPPRLRTGPPSFLRRFVDPQTVAAFLGAGDTSLTEAGNIHDIPAAVWAMYEVIGADSVGISCRCGLDPSLNAGGLCSGIIGRPMQAEFDGRSGDLPTVLW